jgi:Phage integrase, N-terminal SAM-like domain
MAAADQGLPAIAQRVTVGAWLDEWLVSSVRGRLRPSTVASYELVANLYLRPTLGRVALAKLTPETVVRTVRQLEARGTLSPRTISLALTVLKVSLNRAVKSGRLIPTRPTSSARRHGCAASSDRSQPTRCGR